MTPNLDLPESKSCFRHAKVLFCISPSPDLSPDKSCFCWNQVLFWEKLRFCFSCNYFKYCFIRWTSGYQPSNWNPRWL